MMRAIPTAFAVFMLLAPVAARAQAPADCKPVVEARLAQEQKDRVALDAILADAKSHGLNALVSHFDDLQTMIERAPTGEIPACNGVRYVRASGPADTLTALAGAAATHEPGQVVALAPSPYPRAALNLGAGYVELSQWAEAEKILARGLALDPKNSALVTEDALAMSHLGRSAQALAMCDQLLAGGVAQPLDRARVLRTQGYLLGELGRYDDAIAAYQQSLTFQPGNGLAQNEIAYLTKLKAGGAKIDTKTIRSTDSQAVKPAQ